MNEIVTEHGVKPQYPSILHLIFIE